MKRYVSPNSSLEILEQVQDLRLDRHVERRDRLATGASWFNGQSADIDRFWLDGVLGPTILEHLFSVKLAYDTGGWHPGSGGRPHSFGPLALSRSDAREQVLKVAPSHARTLCGQRLDWVEAVR